MSVTSPPPCNAQLRGKNRHTRAKIIFGPQAGFNETGMPQPDHKKNLDEMFSTAYEELRRLASSVRRGDPSATLNPTALVNEAWIKNGTSLPTASRMSHVHAEQPEDY